MLSSTYTYILTPSAFYPRNQTPTLLYISLQTFIQTSASLSFSLPKMIPTPSSIRKISKLAAFSASLLLALFTLLPYLSPTGNECMGRMREGIWHRKLLEGETRTKVATTAAAPAPIAGTMAASKEETNRIWGEKCSKSDIVINQGATSPLPNGIPTYTVEIMNVCFSGCNISAIHLNCGWFSSAWLVNPRIFKRLRYNDCLVNSGKPLINGRTISFEYANTFSYPLSVASILC